MIMKRKALGGCRRVVVSVNCPAGKIVRYFGDVGGVGWGLRA